MKNILEGLTREQALGCLLPCAEQNRWFFVRAGIVYSIPTWQTSGAGKIADSRVEWERLINSHFDALDAEKKPRWAEPEVKGMLHGQQIWIPEHIYQIRREGETEIARTNARRVIEAFIKANDTPRKSPRPWKFYVLGNGSLSAYSGESHLDIGAIHCYSPELAEEVIRRYPKELALLASP